MELEPGDIVSVDREDLDWHAVAIVRRVDGRRARINWITRPYGDEISDVLTDGGYVAGLAWCEVQKLGHCDLDF